MRPPCTNLPPGWVAAYLDVERLDSQWCRITAWPPYAGTESPQIAKCYGETWGDWKAILTNADIQLYNLSKADFLYDKSADACVLKWLISNSQHYQIVVNATGIAFDRWDGTQWVQLWSK